MSEVQFYYWRKVLTQPVAKQVIVPLNVDEPKADHTHVVQLTLPDDHHQFSFPA